MNLTPAMDEHTPAHPSASFENILTFVSVSPAPSTQELNEAKLIYDVILRDCEKNNVVLPTIPTSSNTLRGEFNPTADDDDAVDAVQVHLLFGCLYEYCPTEEGRNNVVRMVLIALFAPSNPSSSYLSRSLSTINPLARGFLNYSLPQKSAIYKSLSSLGSELLASFFVPLKAQGRSTPAVRSLITPTSRSQVNVAQQGTTTRLSNLRTLVLARDGGRCVVTGIYDNTYLTALKKRLRRDNRDSPIFQTRAMRTEAAHIIPHALNALDARREFPETKHTMWRIMNMFDPGISQMLQGSSIDTPTNALLLIQEMHARLGALESYFEEVDSRSNTYRFLHTPDSNLPPDSLEPQSQTLTFKNHEEGQQLSELPSPRLLRFHRACCLVLSASGAAEYVERLLRDADRVMERGVLATDGSSDLDVLLRMQGLYENDSVGLPSGNPVTVM